MTWHTFTRTALILFFTASFAATANAQSAFYTFTSGTFGDGFNWPASPTGILDGDTFITPDESINIENFTGNNTFFDSQYQAAGNSSAISGDAWWGNPDTNTFPQVGVSFINSFNGTADTISFDFSWAIAGQDADTFVDIDFDDGQGNFTIESYSLFDIFNAGGAFGGFNGASGTIDIDVQDLFDEVTGDPLQGIESMMIDLSNIAGFGATGEFAIDNLQIDGGTGGPGGNGEVFPSVNQGQFDITGSTNGTSVLRGTGTAGIGLEVTNASGVDTTFSVQLQPGGGLSAGTLVSGDTILDGESLFTPNIATVDRSLPAGDYTSQVVTINDGDPLDPDNTSSLSIDLLDAPLLSGTAGTVDVSAGQDATLSNAAGPFRASVKFDPGTTTTTGPFTLVSDFDDVRVLPGGSASATLGFNRFGQLSGTRTGTLSTSLTMTHYIINAQVDFESLLGFAEPVPDQTWNLTYLNVDATADNANISTGFSYFHILGVNTFDVAATLIDGTSSKNQNVGMQIVPNPDPTSADLIGDAVDLIFGGGAGDQYALQLTYEELALPVGATESELQLLVYNTVLGDWEPAVDGNTAGTPTFFNGSYADYLAGPGGGLFDAGDLGAYGLDTLNNQVWAVLDHASLFGVGVLTTALVGDLDGDGFVGINDLNIVLGNWNQNVPPANPSADPSGDGFVGIEDLNTVLGNWNVGTPPGATTNIPEPGALTLLGLGGAALFRRR
jgi:MYXO-CTERM domain-containing protein